VAPAALAAPPAARAALWDQVLGALPRADLARFDRIPASMGGHPHPLLAGRAQRALADSHAVDLPDAWETLYRDRCSSRNRAANRRKLRRMAREGEVVFEVADTPGARLDLLPTALELKSAGYARLGVEDLFAHPGRRAMLEELARQPDSPLHISALRVGGVVRATHVGALYGDILSYLFPGYARDELAAQSPGAELCRRVLAWACERGVRRFDFTLGDEPYKDRWCDRVEAQYTVTLPRTRRGRVLEQAWTAKGETLRALKASDALYPRLLALRSWWGHARERQIRARCPRAGRRSTRPWCSRSSCPSPDGSRGRPLPSRSRPTRPPHTRAPPR
jgi:CelD/BcsL family acetyltransferase involved in cellulose biosynthesis